MEFVTGSVRINGEAVESSSYTFDPETGVLNIFLTELSANTSYVTNFEVTILDGDAETISQTVRLYGPANEEGNRSFIGEVSAGVTVVREGEEETTAPPATTEAPEPTTVPATTETPEPTTVPATTDAPEPTTTVPATTDAPEPTTVPVITEAPEPTTVPEATEAPEPTTVPDETVINGGGNNAGSGSGNNSLPQTGSFAASIALAGAGTSFLGAGTILAKKKR